MADDKKAGGPVETTVFPIPGRLVIGEPMEFGADGEPKARKVASKTEAERLISTGGFAGSLAEANAAAWSTPEAKPASTDNVKQPPPEAAGEKKE